MAKIEIGEDYDMYELLDLWTQHALAGQTFMLIGPPGIGKTQWVYDIAKKVEEKTGTKTIVKVFHPARSSNTDYVIPIVSNGEIVKALTKELRDIAKTSDENGNPIRIIAFFDEWDRADGMTRNALLSLINERIFEDIVLPPTTSIILAGNQNYSRDTNELNQAEKSRMPVYVIDMQNLTKTSKRLKYWLDIARNKLHLDERIISFIATNPSYLYMPETGSSVFPTPRSWEILSKTLPATENMSDEGKLFHYASCVGLEAGSKFKMYIDYILKMPSAEEILDKKIQFEEISKQYASLHVLSSYVKDEKTFTRVVKFIKENYGNELLTLFILMNFKNKEMIKIYNKAIQNSKNADLIKTLGGIAKNMMGI
jgi:hypothetical protein